MERYNFLNTNKFSVHQKIVKMVGKHKKVLDVGCSVGNLSANMKINGCEVVGIEIDEKSAQIAKNYCKEVFVGNVELIELNDIYKNYFDFIVFADVLEHLRDPGDVLKRFKGYLKDDGYIIISLPNVANWRMRINLLFGNFEYTDHGLLDKGHIKFFNVKNSKKLIKVAGLEIVAFDLTVGDLKHLGNVFYKVGKLWSNLLAFQFLIITKKKD